MFGDSANRLISAQLAGSASFCHHTFIHSAFAALHYFGFVSTKFRQSLNPLVLCVEMEGKEEDVKLGANKYSERQPLGTAAQTREKDYKEPGPAPLFEPGELASWSFWRAGIAEFMATFLFLYITILTVMGVKRADNVCTGSVGIQGIAWAFGGMIFCLVYCTAGISCNNHSFLAFSLPEMT